MSSTSPGLKIGSIRGVPVYLGRTWPIIALLLIAVFGPQFSQVHPEWGLGAYLAAFAAALLLLLSVLLHEAAHAITGQLCGYRVNRVVADLWGGHTAYDTQDATPGRSALVAAVGPLSNAVLALGGYLALPLAQANDVAHLLTVAFTWTNGFVALFNALPGLPLDGGFVVDALVWKITGSRAKGMKAAGWCGRLVAVAVVAWAFLPLATGRQPSLWTLLWTLFIASFLWRGASAAVTVGTNREFLSGIDVARVIRSAVAVPETTPVADLPETAAAIVLLDTAGRPTSVVAPGAHVRVPMSERARVPASALGQALTPDATALVPDRSADITAVLPAFEADPTPQVVIVTEPAPAPPAAEKVVGIVLLEDLERTLNAHAQRRAGQ